MNKYFLSAICCLFVFTLLNCGDSSGKGGSSAWTRLVCVSGKTVGGSGISVDSGGNSYITGNTSGSIDGQALTGTSDIFVIKYDAKGNRLWTRLNGAAGEYAEAYGISVDSGGNSYVTGYTTGALDGQTLNGSEDLFVIKYDTNGNRLWTRQSGVSGYHTEGTGISVDPGGNSYVTGITDGALDGQTKSGVQGAFVIKYDTNGNKLWTRLSDVPGDTRTQGKGISVDSGGNSYVTGKTDGGKIDGALDGQTLSGDYDMFVIKYNTDGVKQWTRLSGVSGVDTEGTGISADSGGNSYATGYTGGALDGEVFSGIRCAFVIKYDADGVKQWTRLSGVSAGFVQGYGIAVDSGGNSYAAGMVYGSLDGQVFDGSGRDAFVIKYSTDGTKKWARQLGTTGTTTLAKGISVDTAGIVYVTGNTIGDLDGQILSGITGAFVTTNLNE